MADTSNQVGIAVPITSTLDGAGLDLTKQKLGETKEALGQTSQAAQDVAEKTGKADSAFGVLGKTLGGLFTVMKLVREIQQQMTEGLEDVSKMEQTFIALDGTTNRLGLDSGVTRDQITKMASAMQSQAGINEQKSIPAMVKLLNLTGDLNKTLILSQLAGDLSVKQQISITEAYEKVTQAAEGRTRGLKDLIGNIDASMSKEDQAKEALHRLQERTAGAMDGAHGLGIEWAKVGAEWVKARDTAIGTLVPALTSVAKGLKEMFVEAQSQDKQISEMFAHWADNLVNTAQQFWAFIKGNNAEVKRLQEQAQADRAIYIKKQEDEEDKLYFKLYAMQHGFHVKTEQEERDARTAALEDARNQAALQLKLVESKLSVKIASLKAEEAAEKDHALHLKKGMELLAAEEDMAVLKAQGDEAKIQVIRIEFAAKRLKLVQDTTKAIGKELDQEVKDAEKAERLKQEGQKHTDDLKRQLADARAKSETDMRQKFKDQENALDAWEREMMDKRKGTIEQMAAQEVLIHQQTAEKVKVIEKARYDYEKQLTIDTGEQAMSVMASVFGESKTFAIAQAVISTAKGAAAQLDLPWPYNLVAVAATIAAGIIQIAKIESTTPGSGGSTPTTAGKGFDDPQNDNMAYLGGRGWARDFVQHVTRGFKDALRDNMGSTAQNSYTTHNTNNIHLHGVAFLDPSSRSQVSKLMDTMDVVQQTRARRITGNALR